MRVLRQAVQKIVNQQGAREPSVATDGERIYLAYGVGDTLYCVRSPDGGRSFSPPVRVGQKGRLSLGMRRGPRIVAARGPVVISAIHGAQGRGQDGDLIVWRSTDGGGTWREGAVVNDVAGAAREGLHAMAAAPDGTLACSWLDLRQKGTTVYASASRDGGKTWSPNALVYRSPAGTVCECCHTSVAFTPGGPLLAMFRNVLSGNRDMYLTRSRDGGKTFEPAQKLGAGTWPLNACPMDGGMVAAAEGKVYTAWRRGGDVYACIPGQLEEHLGKGQQPWLAATSAGPCYVWLQGRPGALMVLAPGASQPARLAESADDPVVAALPRGRAVVAWVGPGGIEIAVVGAEHPGK